MPTASSLAWKTSLRKSGSLWHCSRLWAWRFTMIDERRWAIAAAYIWASNFISAGYVIREELTPAWLQNSKKRAERSERLMYEQSHRDYLPLWLSASSSACHGAVNHYRDNAITYKAQRDKNARVNLEAGERGNYWHADASAWCCCARCKIHEGVSWC